jgi:hypothetical protein
MSRTPLPKEGCFQASHPSITWKEVPCTTAPEVPYVPTKRKGPGAAETVGDGSDFSSQVSGTISWAEGSFPSVTGVTSVTDGTANNFSLQLNSNFFSGASLCKGARTPSSCLGWQQFIYAPGVAFMQYWLIDYVNACPSGWATYESDCFKNSTIGVAVPTQPIANLANLSVTGKAGSTDSVTMSTGNGALYAVSQATVVNLSQGWKAAEFNIVGNANSSEAVFNAGASVVVQTLTDSVTPTTAAPTCESEGFTAETNSLSLLAKSCCPFGGASPGIQFMESNVSGATAQSCPMGIAPMVGVFSTEDYGYPAVSPPVLGDWAVGDYKGQCALGRPISGVSRVPGQLWSHAVECGPPQSVYTDPSGEDCYARQVEHVDNRGDTDTGTDWDPGSYKTECAANEYVAGVSQSDQTGALTSVLCCAATVTHKSCDTQVFYNGDSPAVLPPDWDVGYYKGQCPAGQYVSGISTPAFASVGMTGAAHAVLCCSP